MEPLDENIPRGIREPVFPLEKGGTEQMEFVSERAGGWLFQDDVIQTIGISIGFCIFLLVVMGIVYLKCKRKRGESVLVPYYD